MTLVRHFLSISMEGYLVYLPWILRRTTFTFLSFYHWWSHKMKKDLQSNRLVPVFVTVLLLWRDIMTLSILWKTHLTGVLLIVLEVESIIIMVDSMRAGTGAVPEIQSWSVGGETDSGLDMGCYNLKANLQWHTSSNTAISFQSFKITPFSDD